MARPDYPEEGLHPQVRFHLRRLRLPVRAIRFHIPLVLGLLQPQSQRINRGYWIVEEWMPLRPYLLNQNQKHNMGKRIPPFLAAMLALGVLRPAVSVQAENAPYVNAAIAETEFSSITAQDMEVIRSKKILLVGYSGSLCMRGGLRSLACGNNMYCILPGCCASSTFDYSIRDGIPVPADAFSLQNFVHYKGPNDGGVAPESFDEEIRTKFSNIIDVAMIHGDAAWGNYKTIMDQLRADFPNINFIYTTPSYKSYCETDPAIIEERAAYIASIRSSYKNVAPLYDLAALTSDDGTCGNQACAAYFTSDCIHYNSAYIESLMGKAFLVMLHKLFANPDAQSPTPPTNL